MKTSIKFSIKFKTYNRKLWKHINYDNDAILIAYKIYKLLLVC